MEYSICYFNYHKIAAFSLLLSLLFYALFPSICLSEESTLFYPRTEADFDERTGYPLALLRLAFKQNEQLKRFQLKPTDIRMPRGRSLKLLESSIAVDIFWGITTAERDAVLTKVDFDLFKGMFGYRLLMVKKEQKTDFESISSASELKPKVAVLGHDWPDFQIFSKNGFSVQGTTSYAGLFNLLHRGRIDYLPRSIFEVWPESEHFKNRDLEVVDGYALYYPISFTYYLNNENKEIALLLENSLKLLEEKGDFDTLFNIVWQDSLAKSKLDEKLIFKLEN